MRKAMMGLGLVLGSLVLGNVQAATWYGFTVTRGAHSIIFFDMDTVTKQPGSVTLWLKTVKSERWPESDGSYSYAGKSVYSCSKRTSTTLVEVSYDKDKQHLKTNSNASKPSDIIPGSLGEDILKVVCASDFPNLKSDNYAKVGGNDIYAAAKRLMDAEDDPAPK